jgi:transposase
MEDAMGVRLQLKPHLTEDEIRGYYLTSTDVVEQTRWQAILLLAEGVPSEEVARITGYCTPWVRTLARRYNQEGPVAMHDGRHDNPGAAGLLDAPLREALATAMKQSPDAGGLWSGPKVAAWMEQRLGRKVRPQRGWEYLRRADMTAQRPRPKHPGGDPAAQESFQAGAAGPLP